MAPVAAPPDLERSRGARVILPGQTPEGEYILSVLVKRTFDIVPNGECRLATRDRPLVPGDVFWDDPMNSSVRFESDLIPFKPATDIVFEATAYAPGGAATPSCMIAVWVGHCSKSVAVVGNRVARFTNGAAPIFTEPAPFTRMEIRYERAYGGTDVYSDINCPYPYPRNPLGRGFVVRNTATSVENLALPNVEDPAAMLTPAALCVGQYAAWETRPMPAGLGWVPKTWHPRALLAGIMPGDRAVERELRQAYAKLLPAEQRETYLRHGIRDMDFRFFNGASPGLTVPFLRAGEWVRAENLSQDGRMRFQLPTLAPRIGLDVGDGLREPDVVIQTVMIRMDDGQVDLVWRSAVPYRGPDWLPEMRKVDLAID